MSKLFWITPGHFACLKQGGKGDSAPGQVAGQLGQPEEPWSPVPKLVVSCLY